MQTYTENAPDQSPKQKVLEQLEQFKLALGECRPVLAEENTEKEIVIDLLQAAVGELKTYVEREWVAK